VPSMQDEYKALLRERIAPALRALGLKGSGARYRLDVPDHFAELGFQSSAGNSWEHVRFTVNLSVAERAAWEAARSARPSLPERPSPNVFYGRPLTWHKRIGGVLPGGGDHWWDLRPETDPARLADEVVAALRDHGLPAMRERM
jgi:Domain of unknown function (DUF4304)